MTTDQSNVNWTPVLAAGAQAVNIGLAVFGQTTPTHALIAAGILHFLQAFLPSVFKSVS